MKNIWLKKNKPLKVLAPMAGYTDSAFRLLCREMGADLVVTELISADAVANNKFKIEKSKSKIEVFSNKNNTTAEMLTFFQAERPLVIQLFGKNPENFAKATKWIAANLSPDGIDINMGCPARKVVGSDHGAALLKKPELACEIVKAVKMETDLPVSVKTRLGWENDDEILGFAPKLAKAGINAITIHGRTYNDGFRGVARWGNIYKTKELLEDGIAVIGNGDRENFQFPISNFQLDGIAIGRAAFGNPWIFGENLNFEYQNSKILKDTILRHATLVLEAKGYHGLIEFRKHLVAYLRGLPEAKKLRMTAVKIECKEDIEKLLKEF